MSLFDDTDLLMQQAYKKALYLLDYAPQTEKTLSIKLYKKGYSNSVIDKVVNKLKENNLMNDIVYAEIYAANLAKIKLMGIRKIILKLKSKGINENQAFIIAKKAISANGGEEEIIKKYIKKNLLLINRLLEKNQIDKIKLKLYNNGFTRLLIDKTIGNLVKL